MTVKSGRRTLRVDASGFELNVLLEGPATKPPVVFLHGGGLTAWTWSSVMSRLSSDHFCVAMDLRGHGDSAWSPTADYGLEAMSADLTGLLAFLHIDKPHVVGMSLGGQTALHAVCHGLNVRSLVLVDVGPRMISPGVNPIFEFLDNHSYPSLDAAVAAVAEFQSSRPTESLAASLRHSMREGADGSWSWKWDPRRRDTYAARTAEAEALWDLTDAVRCPVLVVRGSRSPVFGAETADEFVARLPDATLHSLDAGHNVQSERPDDLADLISSFHRGIVGS